MHDFSCVVAGRRQATTYAAQAQLYGGNVCGKISCQHATSLLPRNIMLPHLSPVNV
jgi:hypothetical protein